jgi:glycosyltransferase involved in cell wall biosynthesis
MKIEFILPTYFGGNPLLSAIACLMAQKNPNWTANVVIDDCEKNNAEDVVKLIDDTRVYYTYLDQRYNDFGHTPRNYGKNHTKADYVIMSGDDNYYMPWIVSEIIEVAEKEDSPGLIYWDMLHSHRSYNAVFECSPSLGCIDIGAFAMRTDIAKQIELGKDFAADGHFIEEYKARFVDQGMEKINKTLYVHN